jgi:lipopolysaccharide/colanic/teichoic acid biosynthesis glycosyltransferase
LRESLARAPSLRPAAAGAISTPARLAKRLLDLTVALPCVILVAPLLLAVAVMIRLTSPGPALFRQVRLGRDRRLFVPCKFRTMYSGCPDDVHREYVRKLLTDSRPPDGGREGVFKLDGDSRITPVGRLLRRTSLDELPQLLNVIRGDMSLVGPRPALDWEAEMFGAGYDRRFAVPPGLTGLWQVSGRNALTMKEGLDLDIEYVAGRAWPSTCGSWPGPSPSCSPLAVRCYPWPPLKSQARAEPGRSACSPQQHRAVAVHEGASPSGTATWRGGARHKPGRTHHGAGRAHRGGAERGGRW